MRAAGVDEVAMLEISCTRSHGACKAPAPSVFLDTQVKVDLMTQALPPEVRERCVSRPVTIYPTP